MAFKRLNLISARIEAGLSQEALAERLDAHRVTISNWENGLTEPYPHFKGQLKELFGGDVSILLRVFEVPDDSPGDGETCTSPSWRLPTPPLQSFVVSHPVRQFWLIAHTDYSTPGEMTADIQAVIKDMTMTTGDPLTRRDVLRELASIPLISLGRTQTLKTTRYEEMLRFCTAALEGCFELYRGNDTEAAKYGFECTATYLPLLETVARNSSPLRKQALDLAAQYAIVKTMLGWKFLKRTESIGHATYALGLSRECGNILLQVSARSKLSYTYITAKNYKAALETMQAGEHEIKDYQRRRRDLALPSGIVGNFYSGFASAQVHNGIDSDTSLKIAANNEPMKECIALIEFTASEQAMETARNYCLSGDTEQAMKWLGSIIDPNTLSPCTSTQSEYERHETLNILVGTLLQQEERDMGQIVCAWTKAMEWTQLHQKEILYDGAMQNFVIMKALWRGEEAIRKLMPLTSHW